VIVIRSPEAGSRFTAAQAELSVSVVDQNQPIKTIKVRVNGRDVGTDELSRLSGSRGLTTGRAGITVRGNENRVDFRVPVNLEDGANRIEVLAANPYSDSWDAVDVRYQRPVSQEPEILPNLWILSVGANSYDDPSLPNLNYAVNDARSIIDEFKAQEGKLYRNVHTLLIADDAELTPTRANIIDKLDYLKQAGQWDVVLFFIAGHGVNDAGGNFFFCPSDASFTAEGAIRPSSAIAHRDIIEVMNVPAKKLVFIDSCHSEGITGKQTRSGDSNSLVRALRESGTVIFTSSRGSELSQESALQQHGVFTWSIIQGMKGEADSFKDGVVTMKELDAYVSETVPQMTDGMQHPVTYAPDGYINFSMAHTQ
jgi:hypothetical protein